MRQWIGLAGWIAVCFAASAVGALVTDPGWYRSLERPDWAPPGSVFGPVWTTLYLLMGIAAWLVWKQKGFAAARWALTLFLVQLAANAAWSWLFFGLRRMDLGFADIALLWGLILATMFAFWRHSRLAACLLLPYLAWVTFAGMLNYALWKLNS